MSEQLRNLLLITCVVFLLIILWAITIGITYWDATTRRKLRGAETAAWVGLVVLVPGIGFGAYLFSRMLGRALSPPAPAAARPRQATHLLRSVEAEPRTGTIAAAEFLQAHTSETVTTSTWVEANKQSRRNFCLRITSGPNSGEEHGLENLPVKIGRGPEVAIRLDEDHLVSRVHAEIYEQTGALRIRDLASTHGTKVNDFSISDRSLDTGDQIQVGISILKVEMREEPV